MNKEALLTVADVIENQSLNSVKFDMCYFNSDAAASVREPDCGTTACIAGYALAYYDPKFYKRVGLGETTGHSRAQELLGLSEAESDDLFYAFGANQDLADITAERAVAVLRSAVETGRIDWLNDQYTS